MSLIVALFLGLTISAEEIFRDRKILKREHFLNLSRTSYLSAKVTILIIISALQTVLFLVIANPILGIKGMFLHYWIALFATAFCANMFGLNISASFNSAITIYIVIPLVIIPMMVLSGAMFPFDKLNRKIGNVDKVPLIAELMPTRWTYEALMVSQFKDNKYCKVEYTRTQEKETYYLLQKKISEADFNKVHRIPELRKALETSLFEYRSNPKNNDNRDELLLNKKNRQFSKLQLLMNEMTSLPEVFGVPEFRYISYLTPYEFNPGIADSVEAYLNKLDETFSKISNSASDIKDRFYNYDNNKEKLDQLRDNYFNYKLDEIVTKYYERKKLLIYKNRIVQNIEPVYLDPIKRGFLGFRTHFYAPSKYIFGIKADTYTFNIILVLLSTIVLYMALYYELLAKLVRFFEKFRIRKKLFKNLVIFFFILLY
jgi:hypothetical protein